VLHCGKIAGRIWRVILLFIIVAIDFGNILTKSIGGIGSTLNEVRIAIVVAITPAGITGSDWNNIFNDF